MSEKLTRQGIRDLGNNRKIHEDDDFIPKAKTYEVEVGYDHVSGGMVLRTEATSLSIAIKRAQQLLRETSTAHGWIVLRVRYGNRIVWDYMNGRP